MGRGDEMQVDRRMGGGMVMSATVWLRSTVWVGEMQVDRRMGRGMVMSATVWVRSTVSVKEMQFCRRTSGGDGDERNSLGEVNCMGRGKGGRGGGGGAELDSGTR